MCGIQVGSRDMFEAMNRAIEVAKLEPLIDRVFDFAETRDQAHDASTETCAPGAASWPARACQGPEGRLSVPREVPALSTAYSTVKQHAGAETPWTKATTGCRHEPLAAGGLLERPERGRRERTGTAGADAWCRPDPGSRLPSVGSPSVVVAF